MKLYYAVGTCSLSPHIVANEMGITLELERVDIRKTPHIMAAGGEYSTVNSNGYVPALRLDDGSVLTEGGLRSSNIWPTCSQNADLLRLRGRASASCCSPG
jgi:glutathione S-transferase